MEVVGGMSNVSALMPEIIALQHNKFVGQSFTHSLTTTINSKEKLVLAQHCFG
jgi:hypothetical protein